MTALDHFRATWTAERLLDSQQAGKGTLLPLPVGVGKSTIADDIIELAITTDRYDLVIYLAPLRAIIEERRWVLNPPPEYRVVTFHARPAELCGPQRNKAWQAYENQNCAMRARIRVCAECPQRKQCLWLRQYGESNHGVRVIFATQAHLARSAEFIEQIRQWTGAERILLILDEADFAFAPRNRAIRQHKLKLFGEALAHYRGADEAVNAQWLALVKALLEAQTPGLRSKRWLVPDAPVRWSTDLQTIGEGLYGEQFEYLVYALTDFCRSPIYSREVNVVSEICFSIQPTLNCDYFILSGTAQPELLAYRLGMELYNPLAGHRFGHEGTHWYMFNTKIGAKKYFANNAKQILDFFARLIAKRWREGKRPLLISKKCFLKSCAEQIQQRMVALGFADATVVCEHYDEADLDQPHVIPIINYGLSGVNTFEKFDAAFCLNSYFVFDELVASTLQDRYAADIKIPLKISSTGCGSRTAGVASPDDRYYDVHGLSPLALKELEVSPVLQAVGRVRPYTFPREIIIMQMIESDLVDAERVFGNLREAREHFGIADERSDLAANHTAAVQRLKGLGWTQKRIAAELGVDVRTVKRHWKSSDPT